MLGYFGNLFSARKNPHKDGPMLRERPSGAPASRSGPGGGQQGQVFAKVFRWRLPDGEAEEPKSVELAGTFTHWQKVSLTRDAKVDAWHVTIHHIPGNRTHRYMLLVDGKPYIDKNCDGLAAPHGSQEERYQILTEKGPRVLMLFAQTR
ncbi:MAG: hypothetical protein RI897_3475 [Verrucomicrobiota bacterium]|jgi:hypothetical protein